MSFDLLDKPAYGSPCNGCGQCCIAVQCPISLAMFGEQELCPALVHERGSSRFACGLAVDTAAFVPDLPSWGGEALTETFALMIGAGIGCDGTTDEEEANPDLRAQMRQTAEANMLAASPAARELIRYFRSPGQSPSYHGRA